MNLNFKNVGALFAKKISPRIFQISSSDWCINLWGRCVRLGLLNSSTRSSQREGLKKAEMQNNEFTADPASKLIWVVFRAGPLLDQIDRMSVITIFFWLFDIRLELNIEYWLLNIEYLISGLTLTPPAKTNSHLLLWWSWTLREGRKWPFHFYLFVVSAVC